MEIVKRDGRTEAICEDKIRAAIELAYADVYKGVEYPIGYKDIISGDVKKIIGAITGLGHPVIDVEDVQDIVVSIIRDGDVARAYSEYRNYRTLVRENKSSLIKSVKSIIGLTNQEVFVENANKDARLACTQRDLIAGEVSKAIAGLDIPSDLLEAHYDGVIKIHDMDYWMQPITNCELVDLKDMFENGTVINGKAIHTPKSLRTAMTLATQIAAQVASSTYGGQTMSLTHLAPYVRVSRARIAKKLRQRNPQATRGYLAKYIEEDLREEIRDAVQTFNYQINTIMTTNGQTPFISLAMYLNEDPEYAPEVALLIEEFLKQRLAGIENEFGVVTTQTFPKLLYFTDENNIVKGSEYYYLSVLASQCMAKRMSPDIISAKMMKEVFGDVFPCMGCRAFLSPFEGPGGKNFYYGRGNLGACSINLPYLALSADCDIDKFWDELDWALAKVIRVGSLRYDKLKGAKAKIAPILWQHGALARLGPEDYILDAVRTKGFTVSIGYSGLYETVKLLTGYSHTVHGKPSFLAEQIMQKLHNACEEAKTATPWLRFALYGTPQEATTGWFCDAIKRRFGVIKDVTDKGFITNSYHVDVRENIDAYSKLSFESGLQKYSTGGAVSYIETPNMEKNPEAVLNLMKYMHDTIIYAEINFESDACGECGYTGICEYDIKLDWYCPQCGNDNQETLSVVRRTCGYLGETIWTKGRKLDIINRVKHI